MIKFVYSNLYDIAPQGRGGRGGGPEPRRTGGPERGAGGPEQCKLEVVYQDLREIEIQREA